MKAEPFPYVDDDNRIESDVGVAEPGLFEAAEAGDAEHGVEQAEYRIVIEDHSSPTATKDIVTGMKEAARKKARPTSARFRSSASPRPSTFFRTMTATTKMKLLRKAAEEYPIVREAQIVGQPGPGRIGEPVPVLHAEHEPVDEWGEVKQTEQDRRRQDHDKGDRAVTEGLPPRRRESGWVVARKGRSAWRWLAHAADFSPGDGVSVNPNVSRT